MIPCSLINFSLIDKTEATVAITRLASRANLDFKILVLLGVTFYYEV